MPVNMPASITVSAVYPFAIAMAEISFIGSIGIGIPKANPLVTKKNPKVVSSRDGFIPLIAIRLMTIGMKSPRSPSAPESSFSVQTKRGLLVFCLDMVSVIVKRYSTCSKVHIALI